MLILVLAITIFSVAERETSSKIEGKGHLASRHLAQPHALLGRTSALGVVEMNNNFSSRAK
ncbi:MAG TPA: hypothetical protein VN456_03330 [Desulfosporosinus sp.]|nr:hypothetical protein [Desulfosporosinus sp.]